LQNYIAAGFDPARFWDITPRLFLIEMEGAALRMRRERELVWWGAMLPHLKKPVSFEQFVGVADPVQSRADRVRQFHAAWDKIDAALARGAKQGAS
jgi:hypothetical protein